MKLDLAFKKFGKNQSGMATLELVILLPILFAMIFGTYSLFNLFFNYNKSIKATQTVSDIISRQTVLDNAYIDRLHNVYRTISQVKSGETSWMRVTTVVNETSEASDQNIVVAWSYVVGNSNTVLSTGDKGVAEFLPTLLPGESVVIVQTSRKAKPVLTWDPIVGSEGWDFPNSFTFPLRFSTNLANTDLPYVPSVTTGSTGDGAPGS